MIYFNKDSHTYRNEYGEFYKSVGEVIGKFKPAFPAELIAQQTEKKTGRPAFDTLAEWELNKQASCDYGNSIHEAMELWIRFNKTHRLPHLSEAVMKYDLHTNEICEKLHSEFIVYSDEKQIAGTIDIIESVSPGIVNIRDIKTNADLDEPARGKFLPPFQDLPCSKVNEYALKLSLYADLLEEMKPEVKVGKLILDHWTERLNHPGEYVWKEIELKRINLEAMWLRI